MTEIVHSETITTNDRFDRLTNLDINTHYRDKKFYLMQSDFMGAFAYWVTVQSPYATLDITQSLRAFHKYVESKISKDIPVQFSFQELKEFINEEALKNIPEVEKLNHRKNGKEGNSFCSRYDIPEPDDDFIDLMALGNNIVYMIMREQITHG